MVGAGAAGAAVFPGNVKLGGFTELEPTEWEPAEGDVAADGANDGMLMDGGTAPAGICGCM